MRARAGFNTCTRWMFACPAIWALICLLGTGCELVDLSRQTTVNETIYVSENYETVTVGDDGSTVDFNPVVAEETGEEESGS